MDVIESAQLKSAEAFRHWYYRAKFRLLLHHLRKVPHLDNGSYIADFGCGVGAFLTFLEKKNIFKPAQMIGVDIAFSKATRAIDGSARILPDWPQDTLFNLVLIMDVLEHIKDDAAVLREVAQHLAPGGYLFITVPAHPWLFSAHDRFLGHYRRYTKASLAALIGTCPELQIVSCHYYYASILPLAAPLRLMRRSKEGTTASDLKYLPRSLNWFLRVLTYLELPVAEWNPMFGLSVVALCRKKSPGDSEQFPRN